MKIIYKYNNLEIAEVINRPSKKIKSPYLADIKIKNKEELAHTPGLGLCGFITKESIVAVSEAEGERKSKYTIELVQIKNDDNKKIWVGANPVTSNLYFNNMIEKNLLSFIPKVSMIKREFTFQKYESRFDFYVETENNKKYIIEIKNVPLVDYPKDKMPSFRKFPERKTKNRNAIFPDGYQSKKGDCVSPRALKHLRELVKIICDVLDFHGKVAFDKSMPEGVQRKALDTSQLNNLGWRASTKIEIGIKKTYADYLKTIKINKLQ